MCARVLWTGGFLASVLAAACKGPVQVSIRDSEGRAFSSRCGSDGSRCQFTQTSGPRDSSNLELSLRAQGRIVAVCEGTADSASALQADCRPVTCGSDDDCPPLGAGIRSSCVGRWCTDPSHEIGPEDAVLLCLAGTGLGHQMPQQVERYALGLNCGTPCRVPAPCQQP